MMRYAITGLLVALMLTGTSADAQDKQDKKVTTTTKVKADNGTVVTLAGCVMIGGATSFLLTNITSQHVEKDKTTAPSASYALLEREGLDLGSYIHHRVELTGVLVSAATKGDDDDKIKITETTKVDVKNGPDRNSSSSETVKVARGPANQFLVATVKTIAPSCGP